VRCYSHLSDDEREQIGLAKALGHSIGTIAYAIGRSKSTISRELSRNRLPSGRYSPLHAAGAYQLRRRGETRIERDRALRTFVVDREVSGHFGFRDKPRASFQARPYLSDCCGKCSRNTSTLGNPSFVDSNIPCSVPAGLERSWLRSIDHSAST
jgi:hypothetical protein